MRVVSLVPSVTETLLDWGIVPVAVTRFCERPALTQVGGTKDPDVAVIEALAPDLVVMNEEENLREHHDALVAAGLDVHVVRIAGVTDVRPALDELAGRLGIAAPAFELPEARPASLRVFVPIWKRPWMTIGGDTYGSSLLAHVGARNVFGPERRYPETELAAAAARGPDVVLAPSEPYPFAERHRAQLEVVAPVLLVDGRDLFWWGSRTVDAVGRLAEVLDGLSAGGRGRLRDGRRRASMPG